MGDHSYDAFKILIFLTQFVSLSLFVDLSRIEQTQKNYILCLRRLAVTVLGGRSKWEANDTDLHKMETPLGRQTLHCDSSYLITGGKHSHGSPFFILCQHFEKANISVTTLPAL